MVSLNASLYVGLSGVRAAQVGLNTTGNNIANINTEGYSRQRADNRVQGTVFTQGISIGTGVDVNRVEAMRELLAEQSLTEYRASSGFSQTLSAGLTTVEGLVIDDGERGVAEALADFFATLERATQSPGDLTVREELLTVGQVLTDELNLRDAQLEDEQFRINNEVQDLVDEVNDITAQIASINRQISSFARPAEDLIDERQKLINDLSQLVGVQTFQLDNNQVQVNILGSNQILVGREIRNELGVSANAANNGYFDITLEVGATTNNITSTVNTGEIGAKLALRDTELSDLRGGLDLLAGGLIIQFNTVHQTGTDLNGNTTLDFFQPDNATALGATAVGTVDPDRYAGMARQISLSDDLRPAAGQPFDPSRIALSATGAVGDNGTAVAMADLRNSMTVIDADRDGDATNDDAQTFERYFGGFTTGLGRRVKTVQDDGDTQEALLNQAQLRRDAASGVNLDEEAASLTQYQRAFEASSRYLNVVNQLTGEILARLGS